MNALKVGRCYFQSLMDRNPNPITNLPLFLCNWLKISYKCYCYLLRGGGYVIVLVYVILYVCVQPHTTSYAWIYMTLLSKLAQSQGDFILEVIQIDHHCH